MYGNLGIRAYRETDITSMGEEKMVVLLYEKMLEHFSAAEDAAVARRRAEMTQRLSQAQRIVIELRNALDHAVGGDIARNLTALYDFVFQEILAMILDQEPQHAQSCRRVLEPLLVAWRQIPPGTAERMRRPQATPAGPEPASPYGSPSRAPDPPTLEDGGPPERARLVSVTA